MKEKTKFCGQCGTILPIEATHCGHCGAACPPVKGVSVKKPHKKMRFGSRNTWCYLGIIAVSLLLLLNAVFFPLIRIDSTYLLENAEAGTGKFMEVLQTLIQEGWDATGRIDVVLLLWAFSPALLLLLGSLKRNETICLLTSIAASIGLIGNMLTIGSSLGWAAVSPIDGLITFSFWVACVGYIICFLLTMILKPVDPWWSGKNSNSAS